MLHGGLAHLPAAHLLLAPEFAPSPAAALPPHRSGALPAERAGSKRAASPPPRGSALRGYKRSLALLDDDQGAHAGAPAESEETGWRVTVTQRTRGKTAGQLDAYYISPEGTRYRSLRQVRDALAPGSVELATPRAGKSKRAAEEVEAAPPRPKRARSAAKNNYLEGLAEHEAMLKAAAAARGTEVTVV